MESKLPSAMAVMQFMKSNRDENGLFSLSHVRMGNYLGISWRTVQRAIRKLLHWGFIEIVKERQGNEPATYKVLN